MHRCDQTEDVFGLYVREARARNLRVIAKIETFYWETVTSGALPAVATPLFERHPDWRLLLRGGRMTALAEKGHNFANPAHPGVRGFLASLCEEIVSVYDVDGLALDYVRYPDGNGKDDAGYDPYTRRCYEALFGVDPLAISPDPKSFEWRRWVWYREQQVLEAVREIRQRVKVVRPRALVCAAVFPAPENQRYVDTRYQNWREMLSRGYLDAILPMVYEGSLDGISREIQTVLCAVPPEADTGVWPVLAIQRKGVASEVVHPPIADQVAIIRNLDLSGFSVFGYGWIEQSEEGFEGVGQVLRTFLDASTVRRPGESRVTNSFSK